MPRLRPSEKSRWLFFTSGRILTGELRLSHAVDRLTVADKKQPLPRADAIEERVGVLLEISQGDGFHNTIVGARHAEAKPISRQPESGGGEDSR